jgi:hypothetical protein
MRISGRTLQQDGRPVMAEDGQEDWSGWDEVCRREAAIHNLLNRYPKRFKIGVVDDSHRSGLAACFRELGAN